MAWTPTSRIISFVLFAALTAFGQQNRLPDAPSPQAANQPVKSRSLMDTLRLPPDTLSIAHEAAPHYDPGHFADETARREAGSNSQQLSFLAGHVVYHGSTSDKFLGRVTDAASGIVLTRDMDGNRRLNSSYLLRVLTASVAHSAYRPYWRRSATQPISDFGSTVGSDAGMNVFHEFEPGILQLVKSHEPKFVSRIGGRLNRK